MNIIHNSFQSETSFTVASRNLQANNNDSVQFYVAKSATSGLLGHLKVESDQMSDYDSPTSHSHDLTAMSIVRGPRSQRDYGKTKASSTSQQAQSSVASEYTDPVAQACLVCGVSVTITNNTSHVRTLDNVWAASTDLAQSSSLVRVMNSVNSAASDRLDIMKVAGDRTTPVILHYLVLYDFHHKVPRTSRTMDDKTKSGKTKKSSSGT